LSSKAAWSLAMWTRTALILALLRPATPPPSVIMGVVHTTAHNVHDHGGDDDQSKTGPWVRVRFSS